MPPWASLAAAWLFSLITFQWIFPKVVPGAHASRPATLPRAGPKRLGVLLCASHRAPEGWLACIATLAFLVACLPHCVTWSYRVHRAASWGQGRVQALTPWRGTSPDLQD